MFTDPVSSLDKLTRWAEGKTKGKKSVGIIHPSYEKWSWKRKIKSKNFKAQALSIQVEIVLS